MKQFKLTNISIENSREYAQAPALWVKGNSPVVYADSGVIRLNSGKFDFTTFFGSLSLCKYQTYTSAKSFYLSLRIKGDAEIRLTSASTFDFLPVVIPETECKTTDYGEGSDGWKSLRVDVPTQNNGIPWAIVGFIVDAKEAVEISDAAWMCEIDEELLQDVNLALATTTFKKEQYITRNASAISAFVKSEPSISGKFTMHVVDNGKTLSSNEIESDCVVLHGNPNAGGAGGFARGMIESMHQDNKATHVILMDDDVDICPESIFRTFALLRVIKAEFRDCFIGGAMMDYCDPAFRFEDAGFMNHFGYCCALKPAMRMDSLHDVVQNEMHKPPYGKDGHEDLSQRYQAWFYCCIPMSEIERRGLPLPLFVRFDDVEYSLRGGLNMNVITLNGICVWHLPFYMRYDPVVALYQVTRNLLIIRATSDAAPLSDFDSQIKERFEHELFEFNYTGAQLMIQAVKDFLSGPDVCFAPGFAEERFLSMHRNGEKFTSIIDEADRLSALGIDYKKFVADDMVDDHPRTKRDSKFDDATCNGQRAVKGGPLTKRRFKAYTIEGKVAVVDGADGAFKPGICRRAETIVSVDIPNNRCVIRDIDKDRFSRLEEEFRLLMQEVKSRSAELSNLYSKAREVMVTEEAWRNYLSI